MKIIKKLIATLALILIINSFVLSEIVNNEGSIEKLCALQCPFQNKSADVTDGECGSQCYIGQCSRGCEAWKLALESSCQDVCNGTRGLLLPRELYCIIGCNIALGKHFQRLSDEIGTVAAPALVADTLTATSLSLEWEGSKHNGTLYRLQWQYAELPGSTWQYCRNHTWHTATSRRLNNLQPYTNYKFRVAALVSSHPAAAQWIVMSASSVVIGTLAQGLPASPPARVRAAAVDSTHVSVTWAPAPFPHGPVLSYVLHLSEHPGTNPHAYSAVKDIVVKSGTSYSYMFQSVPPARNLTLSVATRNRMGAGPPAITNVSTPAEPEAREELQPVLLLGTKYSIIKQNSDMFDEPHTIFNSSHHIHGFAVHVRLGLLFISDRSGQISRLSLEGGASHTTILDPNRLGLIPWELSIDWLNDVLYIVGETKSTSAKWQVLRCNLQGEGLTVAVAGFQTRPLHLQVDPYNGYMFWVMGGTRGKGGLYRMDLAEVSNGVRHETRPELILDQLHLGAFTVDHANFRLLVADQGNNTVLAVSLDGKEVSNIRKNTQQPIFDHVTSLATANSLFYWTDGETVLGEEYHPGSDSYYHHTYPQLDSMSLFNLAILLPAAQPTPVPVNPPSALQAVLGHNSAKVAWQAPHLLGGQGKGAWQSWWYEVQVKDEGRGIMKTYNATSTSLTLVPLHPETRYSLRACAYTSAGRGPWSSEFRGRSFRAPKPGQREASIVWGAEEGLMQTDTTGERVEALIHADSLRDKSGAVHVSGVAWFEDMLYLATNASRTLWFNLTSRARGHVRGVDSAGSIAVDWLGKRLYWSNPKQQLITRGSLIGDEQEPLPILTVAKELHIDSLNAFLYWTTGHAVECARLNGQHRHTYYPAQLFSGKQVMGVTLDREKGLVFWIVRSYEGSLLFRAPMAKDSNPVPLSTSLQGQGVRPEKVTSLMHPVVQGPLCYYSEHLLWLQDSNNAVISGMMGQGAAVISGPGLTGLNVVSVIDPATHLLPSDQDSMNVIPESVGLASVRLIGTWDEFNVTWQPVTNVNYGRVFYELKIWEQQAQNDITLETDQTTVQYPKILPPYSQLDISVRAFTYWGTSHNTGAPLRLHSPSAPPSPPTNPRVFVQYTRVSPISDTSDIAAVFRWDPPVATNGIISAYRVKYCLEAEDEKCIEVNVDPGRLEYSAFSLLSYSSYSFQVWAHTEAGEGQGSETSWADTAAESPVPRLLVATRDSLTLRDCDRDSDPVVTLVRGETLSAVAMLASEHRIFYLSQERTEILSCLEDGSNHVKVMSLNGTGSGLSLDWVARSLYWAENNEEGGAIYRLELQQQRVKRLVTRPAAISAMQVSPLSSTFYWVEHNTKGEGNLMTAQLDGNHPKPFFSNDSSSCSCRHKPVVGSALSLDTTREDLLWSDALHGDVIAAKLDGCKCEVVINATIHPGLPAVSLTMDRGVVFWSGGKDGSVFSADIKEGRVSPLPISGVRTLSALGTHLQPFPEPECLVPQSSNLLPRLGYATPHSLSLKLPTLKSREDDVCDKVSLPSPLYHLYYHSCDKQKEKLELCQPTNTQDCKHLETYDLEVELRDLEPFSCYIVMLGVGNYYTQLLNSDPLIGEPQMFHTQAGAPSEPRNVKVELLSPWSVRVSWLPPAEVRGTAVRYEVVWSTGGTQAARQRGEQPVTLAVQDAQELETILDNLHPNQAYLIWVRAYSASDADQLSESSQVEIQTFPQPRDIELVHATPYCLNVTWPRNEDNLNIKSQVQYAQVTGHGMTWFDLREERFEGSHQYIANDLSPKTMYQFRVSLRYPGAEQLFNWPPDNRFTFETLGDRPSAPGTPHIVPLPRQVYKLSWEPSREHGAPVEWYLLQGRVGGTTGAQRSSREAPVNSSKVEQEEQEEWKLFYNGSENYWIISTDLRPSVKYSFRACARNAYGVSAWSAASEVFDWSEAAQLGTQQNWTVVSVSIAATLLILVLILGILITAFRVYVRRREKEKKALQVAMSPTLRPDVELATLREVPRGRSGLPLMQHTNVLYTGASGSSANPGANEHLLAPTDQEVAALPHIRRDQITLTKFLGSGAFGEVFEGLARSLPGEQERVAVKTLRKGATEQEKGEFLKEAQLMSNFKHAHILQLLGVCLDNDPNFIIMELMEGGDLLSHLRSSRPLANSGVMTLLDLLSMCVDVARGCRYLEEMHFVHRDLACRNCLVSFSGQARVVKIGDFGLARDIYKSDYYRKEGEGLLPVRWMAPESLMDGVFTSQSDVWAFGVLIWEILTLGQQPYPARTNLEVLHYVRNGGRLNMPPSSPDEMNELMLKCWNYFPENRPTFKHCLDVLESLHATIDPVPLTGHYVGHTSFGMENAGFFDDESSSTYSGDRPVKDDDSPCHFDAPSSILAGAVTVSLPPEQDSGADEQTQIPKYLELIYEPSDCGPPLPSDGYEMPRKLPPLEFSIRPRALSVGCQDMKKLNSLEQLKTTDNNVAYCNVSLSQPLLSEARCSRSSDETSGFNSETDQMVGTSSESQVNNHE